MSGPGDFSAFSSGGPFAGFAAPDFDAYLPKKWTSNAYTLARRNAKDKLLAVAHAVETELKDELGSLELHGSDEAPSVANGRKVDAQWAFFLRDAALRAELKPQLNATDLAAGAGLFDIALQHHHACLALRLDEHGLSVGIEIAGKASVDRNNIVAKLTDETSRQELVDLCAALPGGAVIGAGAGLVDALDLELEAVDGWRDRLESSADLFVTAILIPRDEEIVAEEALLGTVVELVEQLLPVYHFFAWSPDNDCTGLRAAQKKKSKQDREELVASISPGDRVKILAGLFSGRDGYLSEIDAKGKAKIMVGPVSVSVDAKDIKAI